MARTSVWGLASKARCALPKPNPSLRRPRQGLSFAPPCPVCRGGPFTALPSCLSREHRKRCPPTLRGEECFYRRTPGKANQKGAGGWRSLVASGPPKQHFCVPGGESCDNLGSRKGRQPSLQENGLS